MSRLTLREQLLRLPPELRTRLVEELQAMAANSDNPGPAADDALAERLTQLLPTLAPEVRPRRRVVVTGVGAITPVGLTACETWQNLLAGQSGVDYVTQFDASSYPTRIGAEVKDFDPSARISAKEARRMARCSQMAVCAAWEALEDAGFSSSLPAGGERTGVIIGTGLGGFEIYQNLLLHAGAKNPISPMRVRPAVATSGLPNMPAFHISEAFGARGPNNTVVTTCAAGTQAIGEGTEWIRNGRAETVLAGGVEALIVETFYAGFTAMRAVSTRNDPPQAASRPFDLHRDGFIIGEGCTILVLEELEHARARGARIYAEVLGHSASADAFHVAIPSPDGAGAALAMRWVLEDAELSPEDIDYINAHGTSTPTNDATETRAIKRVFGEHAYRLCVSSTKSMIGHAFGGAGASEALATLYSVYEDMIHPTINYETPDPECDLDYVPGQPRKRVVRAALSNSFGLGGQNACLILGKYRE